MQSEGPGGGGGGRMRRWRRAVAACAAGLLAAGALAATPLRDIRDFGAVADGATLNTAAINRAITETAQAGGGTVFVPAGRFVTGTLYLKSGVTLMLDNGAELVGSTDLRDYPENPAPAVRDTPEFARIRHLYPDNLEFGRHSLIYAADQHDVAVVGHGRINGRGSDPSFSKAELQRRGLAPRAAYLKRPYGLCFVRCTNVQVRDLTLEDLAFWCQDYLDCDGVVVDGVTVNSRKVDANNDGIDIDGSRRVRVSNCNFNTGDDSICLKASFRDCEDVTVTNSVCSSLANGVKFGTASNGGFKNIVISNLVMRDVSAAGLALEVVDGGTMSNVAISNVTMERVGAPFFLRLGDRGRRWMTPADQPAVGRLRDISISNVTATVFTPYDGRPLAGSITGLPGHPVENVSISDLRIIALRPHAKEARGPALDQIAEHVDEYPEYSMFGPLPCYGLFVRHARGLTLRNLDVRFAESDYRSAIVCDRVEDLVIDGLRAGVLAGGDPVVRLSQVRGAILSGAMAAEGTDTYLRVEGNSSRIVLHGNELTRAREQVSLEPGLPRETVVESRPGGS